MRMKNKVFIDSNVFIYLFVCLIKVILKSRLKAQAC